MPCPGLKKPFEELEEENLNIAFLLIVLSNIDQRFMLSFKETKIALMHGEYIWWHV